MHPLDHQFAASSLDESNKMPENLTKIWHFSKAANGKYALCYASSFADNKHQDCC